MRCDRCGGKALATATLPGGLELSFCDRHLDEHVEALETAGAEFQVC